MTMNCPDDDAAAKVIAKKLSGKQQANFDNMALRGAVDYSIELEQSQAEAFTYAQRLARQLAERFYPETQDFNLLPNLIGILSQIDNMTCGLIRAHAASSTSTDFTEQARQLVVSLSYEKLGDDKK